jgi:hypothetical protein
LAGEWYDWFLARHSSTDKDWEQVLEQLQDAMRAAVGRKRWEENHPNELWEQEEELRETLRPLLADTGETSQFLATKTIALNNQSRALFLDFLYKDLAAALKLLIRHSEGDFSRDTYGEKFPKLEDANCGNTPVLIPVTKSKLPIPITHCFCCHNTAEQVLAEGVGASAEGGNFDVHKSGAFRRTQAKELCLERWVKMFEVPAHFWGGLS